MSALNPCFIENRSGMTSPALQPMGNGRIYAERYQLPAEIVAFGGFKEQFSELF